MPFYINRHDLLKKCDHAHLLILHAPFKASRGNRKINSVFLHQGCNYDRSTNKFEWNTRTGPSVIQNDNWFLVCKYMMHREMFYSMTENMCLTASPRDNNVFTGNVYTSPCDPENPHQRFTRGGNKIRSQGMYMTATSTGNVEMQAYNSSRGQRWKSYSKVGMTDNFGLQPLWGSDFSDTRISAFYCLEWNQDNNNVGYHENRGYCQLRTNQQ